MPSQTYTLSLSLGWINSTVGACTALQELVSTAIEGTRNVINASADAGIRRVVFTSTFGAVHMDPNRRHDTLVDETCWSDLDYCKRTNVRLILNLRLLHWLLRSFLGW